MMPPPLHLYDIRLNVSVPALQGKQKGAKIERTSEGVYVGC